MSNHIDFDNTGLAWKFPHKKMLEIKPASIHHVSSSEPPPLVQIPSSVNHHHHHHHQQAPTTLRIINANPTQQIQSNNSIIHHHNIQNRQIAAEEFQLQHNIVQIQTVPIVQQQHDGLQNIVQTKPKRNIKIKMKKRKVPVDGMAYHSRQLGLKVPPKKTLGIKGMVIHSQTREVIHNVYKFMKDEAQNGTKIPIANYRERVLAATGISKCTYSKITSKEFANGTTNNHGLPKCKKEGVKFEENEPDGTHDDNNSMYRPRINRDASTRDGIYNLEELVPTHVLSSLEQGAINIINTGNVTDLGLCGFVAANIQKILTSNIPHEVMVRNISIFLYIQYLIHFMNTPMKFVTKKFVVCDKSAEVNNHILDNFSISGPNGRTRPVHMKDKSLCYIIILSALGIDYEVDLANLAKDCKIGVKKALEISRILAFNTSSKNKNVVTLKLPLPAPVVFTPKRKRK